MMSIVYYKCLLPFEHNPRICQIDHGTVKSIDGEITCRWCRLEN